MSDSMTASSGFPHELERWQRRIEQGPPVSITEAEAYTRQLARSHYENFPVVTWLLPRELQQPFCNIYAFCRWADDLGDEIVDAEESLRLLEWWRSGLSRCFSGEAEHPVYVALGNTLKAFSLPSEPFHDLISAFERDQRQSRYETFHELLDYCRQSANPVGRLLLHLTESANEQTLSLSDDVCTGLQLINFWQDVRRDYEIDRVYLPREDRQRFFVEETDLASAKTSRNLQRLLQFEVERAEACLRSGEELSRLVPRTIRFDIRLFYLGGLSIARKIRQQEFRVLEKRPRLSKIDLPSLFWRAWFG